MSNTLTFAGPLALSDPRIAEAMAAGITDFRVEGNLVWDLPSLDGATFTVTGCVDFGWGLGVVGTFPPSVPRGAPRPGETWRSKFRPIWYPVTKTAH